MSIIEQAIATLESRQAAREAEHRAHAEACVRQYLELLTDPNASPAVLAEVAADCGFTAADMREHLAHLTELAT